MEVDPSLEAQIQKAEERYGRNPEGRVFAQLADLYRKAGNYQQALAILEKGLEEHPDYLSAHIVRARVLMDSERTERAVEAFHDVLERDSENLVALRALADLARERDEMEVAKRWYGRLLRIDPLNEEVQEIMADITDQDPEEIGRKARRASGSAKDTVQFWGAEVPQSLEELREHGEEAPAAGAEPAPDEPESEERLAGEAGGYEPSAIEIPEVEEDETAGEVVVSEEDEEEEVPDDVAVSEEEQQEEVPDDVAVSEEDEEAARAAEEGREAAVEEAEAVAPEPPEPPAPPPGRVAGEPPVEEEREEPPEEAAPPAPEPAHEPVAEGDEEGPDEEPEPAVEVEGAPAGPPVDEAEGADDEEVFTETLAGLYARQGFYEEAVEIYEELLRRHPDDETLRQRMEAVREARDESGLPPEPEQEDVASEAAVAEAETAPSAEPAQEPSVADAEPSDRAEVREKTEPPAERAETTPRPRAKVEAERVGEAPIPSARDHFRALLRGEATVGLSAGSAPGEGE